MKKKLQVFISSTFTDLVLERQAAVSAILKAGHIPAGMELFTAGDRSQMETINTWIDESDVYMLILGGRYGSVERDSGISYTELEYDYAIQQGKPVFAVVITEPALAQKVKDGGIEFMERENPKELALFRTKALSNISSFFEDFKDIKLCVYESLADFAANRDLKGWVPGDELVDTKPLFEEISKLSDENRALKDALAALEKKAAAESIKPVKKLDGEGDTLTLARFDEIKHLLRAIEIKLPPEVTGEQKESSLDLLSLFISNKEALITGVTNAHGSSASEIFFYHNMCPKLQVHGLIENEKVVGVRYRRSFVSKLGHAFLAHFEKQDFLKRDRSKKAASPKVD